jgi:hypothetical protein
MPNVCHFSKFVTFLAPAHSRVGYWNTLYTQSCRLPGVVGRFSAAPAPSVFVRERP